MHGQDEAFSRDLLSDARFGQLRSIKYLCVKNLAHLAEKSGQMALAVHWYGEAVGLDDREFLVWYKLGCAAFEAGKMNVSRLALERAVSMRTQNVECLDKLCEVLFIIGDFPSCFSTTSQILQLNGSHARARLFQALIMRTRSGTKLEGEEMLEEVLQENGLRSILEQVEQRRAQGLYIPEAFPQKNEPTEVVVDFWTWEEVLAKTLALYQSFANAESALNLNAPICFSPSETLRQAADVVIHQSRLRPSQYNPNEAYCLACGGDYEGLEDELLLCENLERCGGAYHLTCLTSPYGPLDRAPPAKVKWFCPACAAKALPANVKKRLLDGRDGGPSNENGAPADEQEDTERSGLESSQGVSPAKRRRSRGLDPERKSRRNTEHGSVPSELQAQLGRFLRFVRHDACDADATSRASGDPVVCQDGPEDTALRQAERGDGDDGKADLTRLAMMQRVADVRLSQWEDVRVLVVGLPRPCGLAEVLRRLVEALAILASQLLVRGRLRDLLLEADSIVAGNLLLTPAVRLALAELHFDTVLRLDRLQDTSVLAAEHIDEYPDASRAELPASLRQHLSQLWPGDLQDPVCRARQAWLMARVREREQRHGQAVAALESVLDWLSVVGAEQAGDGSKGEILLPSCAIGNRITKAAVQRRLRAPRAGAEADSVARIVADLQQLAAPISAPVGPPAAPCSASDAIAAAAVGEGARGLIAHAMTVLAPEFRVGECECGLVRRLPPRRGPLAAMEAEELRRREGLSLLFSACCGCAGHALHALHLLNLLLADLVGVKSVLDESAEDPILYRPLTAENLQRARRAADMARTVAQGKAGSLREGGAALCQLEVQLGRLVVRLGATRGAGAEFHAACMALLEVRDVARPSEVPAQRQKVMAATMEELVRRGVANLNSGEFFCVYLPLLRSLRPSAPPAAGGVLELQEPELVLAGEDGGDGSGGRDDGGGSKSNEDQQEEDQEEEEQQQDEIDREMARCYYVMYGLRVPAHQLDYEGLDALPPREDESAFAGPTGPGLAAGRAAGRAANRCAALIPEPEVCMELYGFLRPHAEKALRGRKPEPWLKEGLELVERLLPEPPEDIAPAAALIRQFIRGGGGGGSGQESPAEALAPDFSAALRKWQQERDIERPALLAAPAPASASDVIMIDGNDDDGDGDGDKIKRAAAAAVSQANDEGGARGVYGSLYRLLAALSERRAGADSAADERVAELYLRDLAVCPTRAASWLGAARALKKALLGCQSHGLRLFPAAHRSAEAADRLCRAARAYSAALCLRPGGAEASYGRGLMLYLMGQGARSALPDLARSALTAGALRDMEACLGRGGWSSHYLAGKLGRKAGRGAGECLGRLLEAGRLNGETGPLGLEPWYKLHSARAKYVLAAGPCGADPAELDVLEAHALDRCTRRADADADAGRAAAGDAALLEEARRQQREAVERLAASAAAGGTGPRFAAGSREAGVLDDVMVAMRAAVERAKNQRPPWPFAKARHRLAKVLADSRAGPDPVASELVCDILGRLFFTDGGGSEVVFSGRLWGRGAWGPSPAFPLFRAANSSGIKEGEGQTDSGREESERERERERGMGFLGYVSGYWGGSQLHQMAWKEFHQLAQKQAEAAEFSTFDTHARLRFKSLRLLATHLARAPPAPRHCDRLDRLIEFLLGRGERGEPVHELLRATVAHYFNSLQRLLCAPADPPAHAAEVYRRSGRLRSAVEKDLARRDWLVGLSLPMEPLLGPAPAPAGASPMRELDALVTAAGRRFYTLTPGQKDPGSSVPADFFIKAVASVFPDRPRPGRLSLTASKGAGAQPAASPVPPAPARLDPPPSSPAGPAALIAATAFAHAAALSAAGRPAVPGGVPKLSLSAAAPAVAPPRPPLFEVRVPPLAAGQSSFIADLPGVGRVVVPMPPGTAEGAVLVVDPGP